MWVWQTYLPVTSPPVPGSVTHCRSHCSGSMYRLYDPIVAILDT